MAIEVTCPSCQGIFHAPDGAAGKKASCPKCGGIIQIGFAVVPDDVPEADDVNAPAYAQEAAAAAGTPVDGDERRPCPMCGEMIQREAIKCRFCGEIFDEVIARAQRGQGGVPLADETPQQLKQRLLKEKQDRTSSILLFALSLFGCFSPILAIYGIIFLKNRPYPFKYKGLAIAGTVLHCFWAVIWILRLSTLHR